MTRQRPSRCWAEIDLAALKRNLTSIRTALPASFRYISIVKADAYGHGAPLILPCLLQYGIAIFAVGSVYEAVQVRPLIGPKPTLLILGPILPEEEMPYLLEYDLTPTLSTQEELERLEALGQKAGRPLDIHLKIDTGMGRLGIWHPQASALYQAALNASYLHIQGLWTHLSSAATDLDYTRQQRSLFLKTLNELPDVDFKQWLIHADNSAGLTTLDVTAPFNAARIGLLQFGISPFPQRQPIPVEPVLSFHTRIGLVKQLPTGTRISYDGSYRLKRPSALAILTGGYNDGIPTSLSHNGCALIQGQRCPFVGRVTMDQTIVDVTDLLQPPAIGATATLIGVQSTASIDVWEFSNASGKIPWEILCAIGNSVPRIIKETAS